MDSMYLAGPARLWKSKADFFRPFRSNASESIITRAGSKSRDAVVSQDDDSLRDLNVALRTLVEVFPDADPAVFRDMLANISAESRVEVVTEQVLRKRGRPVGRDAQKNGSRGARQQQDIDIALPSRKARALQTEDTFRGEKYHNAVKTVLYQEFKSLSHSSIRAVMAENNGSYTRTRLVLQQLAARTWRFSIANLWNRKTTSTQLMEHPALLWLDDGAFDNLVPTVKGTGSLQLDEELHLLFVKPLIDQRSHDRMLVDVSLASRLNTEEAESCHATYDCECCYATVAFEDIATCGSGEHMLCHDCIVRTTSEALYGQGWAQTADLDKATIRCFAPAITECQASIPKHFVQQALERDLNKSQVWQEFQSRISSECLLKSRIPLERCPHCTYAEVDEIPSLRYRSSHETTVTYSKSLHRHVHPVLADVLAPMLGFATIMLENILYAVCLPMWLLVSFVVVIAATYRKYFSDTGPDAVLHSMDFGLTDLVNAAVKRVYKHRRGLKFRCHNPSCASITCTRCRGTWHDPHICFEDEKISLRTTIEASATAAVKRTCPRCMLSFVKSSGCNKLVCNCGYTMCYVCRAEITSKEGYGHFCQHFRPSGGRCNECERCDLYGDEDEEAAIRRAAVLAEQEWREKEALKSQQRQHSTGDSKTAKAMIEAVLERGRRGKWYEEVLDFYIDCRIIFLED